MKYNPFHVLFIVLALFAMMFQPSNAGSCVAGRGACVASCQSQNCATGYCNPPNAKPHQQTCVCSRCSNGPPGNYPWQHSG